MALEQILDSTETQCAGVAASQTISVIQDGSHILRTEVLRWRPGRGKGHQVRCVSGVTFCYGVVHLEQCAALCTSWATPGPRTCVRKRLVYAVWSECLVKGVATFGVYFVL